MEYECEIVCMRELIENTEMFFELENVVCQIHRMNLRKILGAARNIFLTKACFICFTQNIFCTEISITKCTYRNFCKPHYRKFLCKAD